MKKWISAVLICAGTLAAAEDREVYMQAHCQAFLLARTDGVLMRPTALIYFDALLEGMAVGSLRQSEIVAQYQALCDADPSARVRTVMQRVISALDPAR